MRLPIVSIPFPPSRHLRQWSNHWDTAHRVQQHIFGRLFSICKRVCPMLWGGCPVSVCCWCIVAKQLDGSRCHLLQRYILDPGHIVLDGDPSPFLAEMGTAAPPPLFSLCLLWPNGCLSQQLLSSCYTIVWLLQYGYGQRNVLFALQIFIHFSVVLCFV